MRHTTTKTTIIKHVLAGGQTVKDIRGHTVELTQATGPAYQILINILQKQEPAATGTEGRCIT